MGALRAAGRVFVHPTVTIGKMMVRRVLEWPRYRRNRAEFVARSRSSGAPEFPFGPELPCLDDRRAAGGVASGDYFHQDLVVAQQIHLERPTRHIDVGSRVDGFVAHVASFREIEVLDIRPITARVRNIVFRQCDVVNDDLADVGQADSVSSLNVIEHFGLGRYGDPIDPDGWRKGIEALTRLTAPGGSLYVSVPIGPQRVEFDAHRVFSLPFLREQFDESLTAVGFWYVDDAGAMHSPSLAEYHADTDSFGCWMGCGILHLRRATPEERPDGPTSIGRSDGASR